MRPCPNRKFYFKRAEGVVLSHRAPLDLISRTGGRGIFLLKYFPYILFQVPITFYFLSCPISLSPGRRRRLQTFPHSLPCTCPAGLRQEVTRSSLGFPGEEGALLSCVAVASAHSLAACSRGSGMHLCLRTHLQMSFPLTQASGMWI